MHKILVVNCSSPYYNLGSHKLFDWLVDQGHKVDYMKGNPGLFSYGYDLVCLSVIFSWHAPIAAEIANSVKLNSEVWAGGPGLYALEKWWIKETGLSLTKGLDSRFEKQRGNYLMTFASRGCPVGCNFCIVPKLEGKTFTFYPDFQPAPILCDNNLSGLPIEYQKHILQRYQETNTVLKDANSGFEPHTFSEEVYNLWRTSLKGPWRFAFDETSEALEVERTMKILSTEPASKKRVYCLIGNEPFEACYERAKKIIEWGGEPHCQFVLPLNCLDKERDLKPKYDWTIQQGKDFCRYFNRWLWRNVDLKDYKPRKFEPEPFKFKAI